MFNNIIYFIIVIFIYTISFSVTRPDSSFGYNMLMLLLTWLIFAMICGLSFNRLEERFKRNGSFRLSTKYQALTAQLSILAIILFAMDVYLFHLKYWLQSIPGLRHFSVLHGTMALGVFIGYLGTIWYFAYPVYRVAFQTDIRRSTLIFSNIKLNMPILFPWMVLTLVTDLIALSPWSGPESFVNSTEGQFLVTACFLGMLVVFLPLLIQSWWGCKPFQPSEKVRELTSFLREKDFKYRGLLSWPIFEGRMLTAGIMGIVPKYRYLLVTNALMDILTLEELKAVMAHEMGHAKYRHLLFYLFFMCGLGVLMAGLFDAEFYMVLATFFLNKFSVDLSSPELFYPIVSLPLLFSLFFYIRFVMGFFMRHYERQADLYSASVMGGPEGTISSLEKIALLSGKIRNLPSWHHFSIRERVEYLERLSKDPGLTVKHTRFLRLSFVVYLVGLISLGYLFHFSATKQNITYHFVEKVINQQIEEKPNNIALYKTLAMIYHERGKHREAKEAYERILELDRAQPMALNNLAWLLITAPDKRLHEKERALELAKMAVVLERMPEYLDTLAEAYYVNGYTNEALETIEEALSIATDKISYFEKQREKFLGKVGEE
ncbi:M48 family metalloprotease [bacterium]|nr:M48 family metalloprotease [bacterium]